MCVAPVTGCFMVQNTLEGVKNIYITFYLSSQVKTGHKICVSVANWCHSVATKPIHFLPCNLSLKYKGSWLSWSLTTSKEDHEFDSFALLVIGEEIAKTPHSSGELFKAVGALSSYTCSGPIPCFWHTQQFSVCNTFRVGLPACQRGVRSTVRCM